MNEDHLSSETSIDETVKMLQQILQFYKILGPQSLESLTKSYLAPAPTAETAENAAEGMMAQAFILFDEAVVDVLQNFAAQQGYDLSESRNYQRRLDEGYFRVAYPALVMYLVWLDREGQQKAIDNIGKFFQSTMLGIAGYMMLDSNLDEQKQNSAEILFTLSLIQEHDRLLLETFDFDIEDYQLLNRFKQLYLKAEIKEKRSRFSKSPYSIEHPEDCGYKAVHGYLPFFLLLQKSGQAHLIDEYLQFFYEWGAPLQIMDDIIDLEEDLKNGHYSYPTIGYENEIICQPTNDLATGIRSNLEHMKQMQRACQGLLDSSRQRCIHLEADLFGFFVNLLEARLDVFFSEILHAQ